MANTYNNQTEQFELLTQNSLEECLFDSEEISNHSCECNCNCNCENCYGMGQSIEY